MQTVKKKAPLTDRTNFTVPTSTVLRKLKASLSFPQNAKKLDVDCPESETSIGSSTYNDIATNPTPHSTPHHANRRGNQFEPVKGRKKAPEKTKDKGEKTSMHLTIYSEEKAKVKGKSSAAPTGKTKDTGKVIPMPISCSSLVNTRSKTKENVEPFSFSTLPRTRKRRDVSNEGGIMCESHSYSAPQPNHNKKKSRLLVGENDLAHVLPREYVEQQLAYFKEIDDFELAEEEVSENESDNEDTSMETLTI